MGGEVARSEVEAIRVTIFRAKGRSIYTVKVPNRVGEWLAYSSGTKHQATARRLERMVEHLGPRGERAWDVLDLVHSGTLSLAELYDRYDASGKDVAKLRVTLRQADLAPLVEPFLAAAHCSEDTKAHYRALLTRLIPEGAQFSADEFTTERLQRTIDEMKVTPATKRKAGAAFRAFGNWLVRRGVIRDNPMRGVTLPKASAPRTLFLETSDAIRLADAQPSPYREFSALLAGSGIEVSVALELKVRDVDATHREIRARGTKTHARDRVVRVADWAWAYVKRAMKGKGSEDLLFADIPDRWAARDIHHAAIVTLEKKSAVYAGYTMRDQRHTYAVRAMRAGAPADLIARQLGHANPTLVLTVYGRFQPSQDERARWEKAASALDRARRPKSRKRPR